MCRSASSVAYLATQRAINCGGLTIVSSEKLEKFHERYDDLYSILQRIRLGQHITERAPLEANEPEPSKDAEAQDENIEQLLKSPVVSEHVKMQCKLVRLGLKAGEKVWVPSGDQRKLRQLCKLDEFEQEFAAGIDLPKSYFENIDVVWKDGVSH